MSLVSVLVCVLNGEKYIKKCLESLLNQTFKDFELVIVDDASTDRTRKIISEFKDERIKYFRNENWLGISKSRNRGFKLARGKYIFCLDVDCSISQDWIAEGLVYFSKGAVGVEGRIIYVSEDYVPCFSDYVMENKHGGQYMGGNVAFQRDFLKVAGGLNENLNYFHDREIGMRVARLGRFYFSKKMLAVHPLVAMSRKRLFAQATSSGDRVYLYKIHDDRALISWRVVDIRSFICVLFPPVLLSKLLFCFFVKKEDPKLLPYLYLGAIIERLNIWKASAMNRVFLI
jgi:glycosyltransferase involved in cell wall biosynthesis